MKRQEGYYWLKSQDKWSIGEWKNNGDWWIIGHDGWFEDSDFEEIDERRIERTGIKTITDAYGLKDEKLSDYPSATFDIQSVFKKKHNNE